MTNGTESPQIQTKKGLSPLAWVGIGCGALILIVVLVLVGGGLFVAHKVKQAGIDPALWKSNPALAASKMITVLNPDLEVVKVDEDRGVITVKDKKTGKVVTLDLKDVEKGKINIETGEEGKTTKVAIGGGEGEGAASIKVTDESGKTVADVNSSGAVKMPAWVPVYPGAEPGMHFTANRETERTGNFLFTTPATVDQVMDFYKSALKTDGFKTETSVSSSGSRQVGTVTGTHAETKRSVNVLMTNRDGKTKITVTYREPAGE